MINFYEKNLEALVNKDPVLAASLFAIKTNDRYEVFQGKDLIDINILDNDSGEFVYDKPLQDVSDKLDYFHDNYVRYPVLFLYGIGNGVLSKALLQNKSVQHLVVVEPSLEMIYIALNFIDIADDIESDRIIIKTSDSLDFASTLKIIERHHIKPYARIYNLHTQSKYYEKNFLEDINEKNSLFLRCYKHMVIGIGNDSIDSLIGVENHIANMHQMLKGYKTSDLLTQKISDVAVIVSTGPSLTKQLPLLKEYAPYMTIISVDASLPILQKHGIKPDIVTSIERVIESTIFFQNLDDDFIKDTYFLTSSLTHPYTAYKLKDRKLILSMRPLSYMKYYELDEFGYMGAGMSAANMAYEAVVNMGYSDIILIGQDLAYADDGISHADGHKYIHNQADRRKRDRDISVEKYGGGGVVKTSLPWDMFKNFFEKDIADAIRWCGAKTYNSTEGGARIHGTIEEPFVDVLARIVDKTKQKSKISIDKVGKEESEKLIEYADKKTNHMYEFGKEIKTEIEELFLKLAKTNEEIEKQKLEDVDYDELLALIEEVDVIKAKVESSEFSKMYIDTVQSFIFHQELNLAKLMVENAHTDEEKKKKLIKWASVHEFWLFSLAGGIDSQLYAIEKGSKSVKERVNEFSFYDSLLNIEKNKINDNISTNSIGFLAIEENLYDKDYVNYIKELYKRFPYVKFELFSFNETQKELAKDIFKDEKDRCNFTIIYNIYDITNNINIIIFNHKYIDNYGKLFRIILFNFSHILVTKFDIDSYSKIIQDNNNALKYSAYSSNPEYFSLDTSYKGVFEALFNPLLKKIDERPMDPNMNLGEFIDFKIIEYSLKNKSFLDDVNNLKRLYLKHLNVV